MLETCILLTLLGVIISKEFRGGIFTFIGSVFVFTLVIAIGVIYSIFYPFVMAYKDGDYRTFFKIWWRLINGTYCAIGDFLKLGFAYRYDELANVWGEWVEDVSTHKEKTKFGDKQITISASIGHLETNNFYRTSSIKVVSKMLNFVFSQRRHCAGSWDSKVAHDELIERNLHGNKK